MTHVFHRHTQFNGPFAVEGDGPYLIDQNGRRYLDASGGAAVSCLGHSHPDVNAAMHAQIDAFAFAHTGVFTNYPMEELAEHLARRAPGDLDYVYFVSGGSEAIEAALLMARQYFVENGKPEKHHVIGRKFGYHGNTIGALSGSGNMVRRYCFDPVLVKSSLIDPCFAYRFRKEGESEGEYALRAAQALEDEILRVGPEKVMAFLAEPVTGSTSGAIPALPGYFKRIREICDKYDVLLILDEVMCGMGRTGSYFACEQDEVVPDLVAIAKALGAGYQPIAALMVSAPIYQTFRDTTGFFQHGLTYQGHAVACAAALAVQRVIERDNLVDRVRVLGDRFRSGLEDLLGDHPHVGDIRGRGLMIGLELVEDRNSKRPFAREKAVFKRIQKAGLENGLVTFPGPGTADGLQGDHVLMAPPFICTEEEIDFIAETLAKVVDLATAPNAA